MSREDMIKQRNRTLPIKWFNLVTFAKCKKHPKYKVMRKPTADCKVCREMWRIKNESQTD